MLHILQWNLKGNIVGHVVAPDTMTRPVHVWVEETPGSERHDCVIYDHTDLLEMLKKRGLPSPPGLYDRNAYEPLRQIVEKAKRSETYEFRLAGNVVQGIERAD